MPTQDTAKPEAVRIKEALAREGTTLHGWAVANGYLPRTVYVTLRRWGDRFDRVPHGGFGRAIMAALRAILREQAG